VRRKPAYFPWVSFWYTGSEVTIITGRHLIVWVDSCANRLNYLCSFFLSSRHTLSILHHSSLDYRSKYGFANQSSSTDFEEVEQVVSCESGETSDTLLEDASDAWGCIPKSDSSDCFTPMWYCSYIVEIAPVC
jgi:hypothetical protein